MTHKVLGEEIDFFVFSFRVFMIDWFYNCLTGARVNQFNLLSGLDKSAIVYFFLFIENFPQDFDGGHGVHDYSP